MTLFITLGLFLVWKKKQVNDKAFVFIIALAILHIQREATIYYIGKVL